MNRSNHSGTTFVLLKRSLQFSIPDLRPKRLGHGLDTLRLMKRDYLHGHSNKGIRCRYQLNVCYLCHFKQEKVFEL